LSESRFLLPGPQVEIEFKPNGELTQTSLTWPPRHQVTLVRKPLATPTRAELERYAGTYYSDELDASYTVAATDSTLTLRARTRGRRPPRGHAPQRCRPSSKSASSPGDRRPCPSPALRGS